MYVHTARACYEPTQWLKGHIDGFESSPKNIYSDDALRYGTP
jgi:hypothetical protein